MTARGSWLSVAVCVAVPVLVVALVAFTAWVILAG